LPAALAGRITAASVSFVIASDGGCHRRLTAAPHSLADPMPRMERNMPSPAPNRPPSPPIDRRRAPAAGALALASTALFATLALAAPGEPAFISGGVGQDEEQYIEAQQSAYNLHMVFSEGPKNAYVTNVVLRIADARGRTVLALDDAGPLTNVKLPPGRYSVSTRYGNNERVHSVVVKPGTPVDLFVHYPADPTSAGL